MRKKTTGPKTGGSPPPPDPGSPYRAPCF
jgi:hypothetical protein